MGKENRSPSRQRDGLGAPLQSTGTGCDALSSQRWTSPLFSDAQTKQIVETTTKTQPIDHGHPGRGWTLKKLRQWIGEKFGRFVSRGTIRHILKRANVLKEQAKELGLELVPLPGYSPDLNPIEGLWKWMREEVTQHHCDKTVRALFDACQEFIELINKKPEEIVNRLWPKFELDPQVEKLRFSD